MPCCASCVEWEGRVWATALAECANSCSSVPSAHCSATVQAKGDLEAVQDANEELSFQVGALSKDLDLARKVGRLG